ncbi:MAG TPA: tetratricopeptide repeat protein, partial [Burkholderiaceae bacterium]|nr:tetratricopeptide repeat protein [Burkholderiaceae bacterium]
MSCAPTATDPLGNPLSLSDSTSQRLVDDFVGGFIACEARAANLALTPHEDPDPLVQAYCATLQMFAESADAVAHARPFIERAQAGSPHATPRERRYIAAVAAWVAGDIREAIRLHEEQAREFPRDLVSLKLG